MSIISPLAQSLTPYVPGEQPRADIPWIKLNTNENPYPPSPAVRPAIEQAAACLPLYPEPTSHLVCQAVAHRHGLTAEQVFVGNGSDDVLALCFPAFFQGQWQPIRMADITYSFYQVYAALFGVSTEICPLNTDFTMPIDRFCQGPCAGVLLTNPNAPTGLAVPLAAIERVLQAQPDCLVLVDEAYVEFGAQSAVSLIDRYPNLLVVRTLSKSHGLAGLRVGYAMGQIPLIDALTRIKDSFNSYPVDRLAQAGAAAALADDAYTRGCCQKIIHTRTWFVQALRERGFDVLDSMANFVFARPVDGDAAGWQSYLRAKGILVRRFDAPRIGDRLRISIGTDADMRTLIETLDARPSSFSSAT